MESQDLSEGCHDDWESYMKRQDREIHDLQKKVALLEKYNDHLEWHCFIYRYALGKVDKGFEAYKTVLEEFKTQTDPACHSCERGDLIEKIVELRKETCKSPLIGLSRKRTRNCHEQD